MDWPWSRTPKRTPKDVAASPRLGNRFTPIGLSCRLGDVIDLSATGARIRCVTKPLLNVGDVIRISVSNGTSKIETRARVVWVRRSPDSKSLFDVGVNFVELTPELMDSLVELARFGFLRPKAGGAASDAAGARPASSRPPASGTAGHRPTTEPRPEESSTSGGQSGPNSSSGGVTAAVEIDDLYAVLNVPRSATKEHIHASFRALARKLHPDHNPAPDADQQFARLSKAYSILRDPDMRGRYDAMLLGEQSRVA